MLGKDIEFFKTMERHIDNALENKVILTIENKKILKNLLFSCY